MRFVIDSFKLRSGGAIQSVLSSHHESRQHGRHEYHAGGPKLSLVLGLAVFRRAFNFGKQRLV